MIEPTEEVRKAMDEYSNWADKQIASMSVNEQTYIDAMDILKEMIRQNIEPVTAAQMAAKAVDVLERNVAKNLENKPKSQADAPENIPDGLLPDSLKPEVEAAKKAFSEPERDPLKNIWVLGDIVNFPPHKDWHEVTDGGGCFYALSQKDAQELCNLLNGKKGES